MTTYNPGDVVEITSRGANETLYHAFPPGSLVKLQYKARVNEPVWSVVAAHPREPGKQLSQHVHAADFKLHTPAVVPPPTAEELWFDSLPTEPASPPVKVLGDHWALATDKELESALGGLRFELAARKEETS